MAIERGVNRGAIVDYVVDNWKTLKQLRSGKEDKWRECIQAYLSQHEPDWINAAKADKRSHRYIPLTWDAVESVLAQLSASLFPPAGWYEIFPAVPGRQTWDDEKAEDMKYLVDMQHRRMKFYSVAKNQFLKQLVIVGNCPWSMGWRTDKAVNYSQYSQDLSEWMEGQRIAFSEFQEESARYEITREYYNTIGIPAPPSPQFAPEQKPTPTTQNVYDGPELIVGNIFDYVQDTHPVIPKSALRIHRVFRSLNYLKRFGKKDDRGYALYENMGGLESGKVNTGTDNYEAHILALFGLAMPAIHGVELKTAMGTFEVTPPRGGEDRKTIYEDYVAVVANDATLIRFEPTPLWSNDLPMQMARLIEVPNQVYGMGLVETGLESQEYANVRGNQIVDAVGAGVNPEYEVVDDGVVDLSEGSGPGKRHLVAERGNYSAIKKDLSGIPIAFAELAELRMFHQQLMRATNPLPIQGGDKTATEVARDASVSGNALNEIARNVEMGDGGIHAMIDLQIQLTAQYMDEPQIVQILQKDGGVSWKEISPEYVRNKWDVYVRGSEYVMSRQQRMQEIMQGIQLSIGTPIGPVIVDVFEQFKMYFKELGHPNVDKLIKDTPENRQLVKQILMAIVTGGGGGESREGDRGEGAEGDNARGGAEIPPGVDSQSVLNLLQGG